MSPVLNLLKTPGSIGLFLSIAFVLPAQAAVNPLTAETAEILFNPLNNSAAQPLNTLASQLGNAVAIYQYVHNNFGYSTYHGSRSGSINTFAGQRGSDVDIATTLIAMLRAQNIPARYAVGTIQLTAAQLTNWLGMELGGSSYVALQVLTNQGIQNINYTYDTNRNVISATFEHVWVEALVPFAQYRGLATGAAAVDCTQAANAALCNWVPLDAGYKQMTYNGLNIDPYNSNGYDVSALTFDYTGYYNAIANATTDLLNKNPLTILEEQLAIWLRSAYPGKTLADVADVGQISPINDGLLPASLPYPVTGAIRNYDSVALHDAAVPAMEPKAWAKYVTINVTIPTTTATTANPLVGSSKLLLAQLNTQPLTLTATLPATGNVPSVSIELGGASQTFTIASPAATAGNSVLDPFTLEVSMDGAPGTNGSADFMINATYNAEIGGYYLVATGGESSNWAQVENAALQLLANDAQYPVMFNPNATGSNGLACSAANSLGCTPYLNNGAGYTTANELINNPAALNALTGGLLYVAASQYYANLRGMFDQANHLMKTTAPILGFLGVVSSKYGAEFIDSTAFSILPQGLLIDMKGLTLAGAYRTYDAPYKNNPLNNYSNSQVLFLGHVLSSLEHETWQALTGFDAISTVRGFQLALAAGSTLAGVQNNTTPNPVNNLNTAANTLPAFYTAVGFGAATPAPFTPDPLSIFNTKPYSWSSSSSAALDILEKTPSSATDPRIEPLFFTTASNWDAVLACFNTDANQLNAYVSSGEGGYSLGSSPLTLCSTVSIPANTTVNAALSLLKTGYQADFGGANAYQFNYLDVDQGFAGANFVYRANTNPQSATLYPANWVANIRNDLLGFLTNDASALWIDYTLPSAPVSVPATVFSTTTTTPFAVDIRRSYSTVTNITNAGGVATPQLDAISFDIINLGN